jgi:hypothetical protein
MLLERTALSKKHEELIQKELAALREKGMITPAMLDFLKPADTYSEKELEFAIVREIERWLLELGAVLADELEAGTRELRARPGRLEPVTCGRPRSRPLGNRSPCRSRTSITCAVVPGSPSSSPSSPSAWRSVAHGGAAPADAVQSTTRRTSNVNRPPPSRETLIVDAMGEVFRLLAASKQTVHVRALRTVACFYELAIKKWTTVPPSSAQIDAMLDLVTELHEKAAAAKGCAEKS